MRTFKDLKECRAQILKIVPAGTLITATMKNIRAYLTPSCTVCFPVKFQGYTDIEIRAYKRHIANILA